MREICYCGKYTFVDESTKQELYILVKGDIKRHEIEAEIQTEEQWSNEICDALGLEKESFKLLTKEEFLLEVAHGI